jgi:co-chaperonin GroES (HSP10)
VRFEPLADRIIISPIEESSVTSTGLLIPDIAHVNKHLEFGEVLAVGHGRHNAAGDLIPLHVHTGDVVAYPRKAAAHIPMPNADGSERTVTLIREADVIAIVHEMPQQSRIAGLDGRILMMAPSSRAMPDVAAENRELLDRAERDGGIDTSDHVDQDNGMTG